MTLTEARAALRAAGYYRTATHWETEYGHMAIILRGPKARYFIRYV